MTARDYSQQTCSVDGCEAAAKRKGMCGKHYSRLYKTGTTELTGTTIGAPLQWLRDIVANPQDECAIWPFAVDPVSGYGLVSFNGTNRTAHRVALILFSGGDQSGRDAAHGPCHNRRCCNPRHLSWKTTTENHGDKPRDGTDNRGRKHYLAKLTEEQVRAILADDREHKVIALEYGVSRSNISNIKAGNHWKWVTQ